MSCKTYSSQRGMTLIELMVAMTIGLFLAMAVTSIIVVTLRQQKITASVNERDQGSTLAIAQLDKSLRSAGSGFSNAWKLGFFGCTIRASKTTGALIPSTLAAPFDGAVTLASPIVAPVIIEKGVGTNGSDILFVMGGNGGSADVPRFVNGLSGNTIYFDTVIGYKANDLLLVAAEGISDCYVTQVASVQSAGTAVPLPAVQTATLGGAYYTATQNGATYSLQNVIDSKGAFAASIGNTSAAFPSLQLLGVGSGDVLFQYDLLHTKSTAPQAIADGVSHLFALYGIDTNGDGKVDSWVDPGSSGWTASAIKASSAKIHQILAVRVAVVTHSKGVTQAKVSPEKIYAFDSLGSSLRREISLTTAQQAQRYRVTESVIPLRNSLLIAP